LMADWGNTFAAIEKISDDAKHDARARLARDRIRKPLVRCARDWMRFSDAVEASPEAKQMINDFNVRFNRTIEIIFGNGQQIDAFTGERVDQIDVLQLPLRLGTGR